MAPKSGKPKTKAYDYSGLEPGMRVQVEGQDDKVWYAADVLQVSTSKNRSKAPVKISFKGYEGYAAGGGGARMRAKSLKVVEAAKPRANAKEGQASLRSEVQAAKAELEKKDKNGDYWMEGAAAAQPKSGEQWQKCFEGASAPTSEKPNVYETSAENLDAKFGKTLFGIVHDNTESIAAFVDLQIPAGTSFLVDVGGGKFDSSADWVKKNKGVEEFLVLDPFMRTAEHNHAVQKTITEKGGADVVTSISVLNVVPEVSNRIKHIVLVNHVLKKGSYAFFKVWPGMWPERGTGKESYNEERGIWQANRWAPFFLREVSAVFGRGNVHCDATLNLIVAYKEE